MGGHALKTVNTKRLTAPEYHQITNELVAELEQLLPQSQPSVIKSYRAKESFGDVDIIVDNTGLPDNLPQFLQENFHCHEVYPNGPVCSFDYEHFQVDLIKVSPENYQTAIDYFSWNDAGNLIGRLAHKMGFKFGFDGLTYQLREGTHMVKEIMVSKDMPQIFAFLGFTKPGFTYQEYQQGFEQLEDMFRFVSQSTYFYPEIYHLENTSHANRIRDRKRPSYRQFLQWIEPMKITESGLDETGFGSREEHLKWGEKSFPHLTAEIESCKAKLSLLSEAKSKFNGALVGQWTGLEGKELGQLMRTIRQEHPKTQTMGFEEWVVKTPNDTLREYVFQKQTELAKGKLKPKI